MESPRNYLYNYRNPGVVWDNSPTNNKTWMPSQMGTEALFNLIADVERP